MSSIGNLSFEREKELYNISHRPKKKSINIEDHSQGLTPETVGTTPGMTNKNKTPYGVIDTQMFTPYGIKSPRQ